MQGLSQWHTRRLVLSVLLYSHFIFGQTNFIVGILLFKCDLLPSLFIGSEESCGPVSYTHLDVYKRQEQEEWGFQVVPVYCEMDELYLGKAEFFSFESDNWVNSFFDGKK